MNDAAGNWDTTVLSSKKNSPPAGKLLFGGQDNKPLFITEACPGIENTKKVIRKVVALYPTTAIH
jgi:hypothetical protein